MGSSPLLVRFASIGLIIGGLITLSSIDFAVFPFGVLICLLAYLIIDRYHMPFDDRWFASIGTLCLIGAAVGMLAGIFGQLFPIIIWTTTRYGEAGNVIDVVQYPLAYATDRAGSLPALLLLCVGIAVRASTAHSSTLPTWWKLVLWVIAVSSLMLYVAGFLNVYLDGEAPALLVIPVWDAFACSWIALGVLGMLAQRAQLEPA